MSDYAKAEQTTYTFYNQGIWLSMNMKFLADLHKNHEHYQPSSCYVPQVLHRCTPFSVIGEFFRDTIRHQYWIRFKSSSWEGNRRGARQPYVTQRGLTEGESLPACLSLNSQADLRILFNATFMGKSNHLSLITRLAIKHPKSFFHTPCHNTSLCTHVLHTCMSLKVNEHREYTGKLESRGDHKYNTMHAMLNTT